jgi:hypothetical protein
MRVTHPSRCAEVLAHLRLRVERDGEQLFFGRTGADPFYPEQLLRRADKA